MRLFPPMDANKIQQLLVDVQAGRVSVDDALAQLRRLPYDDLGHTRLDLHRSLRQGLPEVVFCQNKTTAQTLEILQRLWQHHDRVLATRMPPDMAATIQSALPEASYDPMSRLLTLARAPWPPHADNAPYLLVATGGTSDMPVAEEAAQTAEFLGSRVKRAYDVGVAGVHRLLDQRELLFNAEAVITVAGMEGALTS